MEGFFTEQEMMKINTKAPLFTLPAYNPIKEDMEEVSLEKINKGKWVVLFFYPADFTFVCPTELKDLKDNAELKDLAEILVCSTDTVFSHRAWLKEEKLLEGFGYKMLADHTGEAAYLYQVLDEKSGMAARGTFIIDPDGILRALEIHTDGVGRDSNELARKLRALQFVRENPGMVCPAFWNKKGDATLKPSIKIAGEVYKSLEEQK